MTAGLMEIEWGLFLCCNSGIVYRFRINLMAVCDILVFSTSIVTAIKYLSVSIMPVSVLVEINRQRKQQQSFIRNFTRTFVTVPSPTEPGFVFLSVLTVIV